MYHSYYFTIKLINSLSFSSIIYNAQRVDILILVQQYTVFSQELAYADAQIDIQTDGQEHTRISTNTLVRLYTIFLGVHVQKVYFSITIHIK